MDDQYKQEHEYAFPTDFPDFRHPYLNATYHGEALTVGTDGYLYALFYVNQGSGYENYYNSIVAQFSIDSESGELSFEDYVTVGKIPLLWIYMTINSMYALWEECKMQEAEMRIPTFVL